jgi:hypothetical protein
MGLRNKIESLTADFITGVLAAIRECSLEELVGDGPSSPREPAVDKPRRGRPPGTSSGRLARRSAEDIEGMADKIISCVKAAGKDGLRAEQIRAEVSIPKNEWLRPLQLALDSKGLTKTGNKRATVYTVEATVPAKAAAKKKVTKKAVKKATPKKASKPKTVSKKTPPKKSPKKKASKPKAAKKTAPKAAVPPAPDSIPVGGDDDEEAAQ